MRNDTCTATRKDGSACQARAVQDGRCFAHHAAYREARRAGSVKGGQGKSTAARLNRRLPANLRDVLTVLLAALAEVHGGTLDPRQATAMSSLAGSIAKLYETAELEERLERLEAANA